MLNELFVIHVSSADHKNGQKIFQQVLFCHKKTNLFYELYICNVFSFIRYLISGLLVNLFYFCLWFVMENFDKSVEVTDPQSGLLQRHGKWMVNLVLCQ